VTTQGEHVEAETVVLALGAWTPHALPWLKSQLRSTGHPVFHLAPRDADAFRPERFPVFCADIQATGYYGFPLHPVSGVVKIARHGPGRPMHPESPERSVTAQEIEDLRAFLAEAFPLLQDAPIVYTRICLYCDSPDGHFWIARDPDRPGLVLATGDGGHAFKFAPVLGALIADVVEGRSEPFQTRFGWRRGFRLARWADATRSHAS
jgi:glycine/D-amino acid oxidase-like deaminating enzyme